MLWEMLLKDFWFYLINLLAFATCIMLTWLYLRQKHLQILLSLKTELAQLRLEQGQGLFQLEDQYKAKEEHIRFVLQDLLSQIENQDAEMLRARRNEISNLFVLEYRKSFYQFIRLASEIYEDNPDQHQVIIENHILPFLQLTGDVLTVLNQENILSLTQTPKLSFQYQDFDFVFDFLHRFLRFHHWGLKKAIRQHAKRLNFKL